MKRRLIYILELSKLALSKKSEIKEPKGRYKKKLNRQLKKFRKENPATADRCLYVGSTKDFKLRIQQHLYTDRSKNKNLRVPFKMKDKTKLRDFGCPIVRRYFIKGSPVQCFYLNDLKDVFDLPKKSKERNAFKFAEYVEKEIAQELRLMNWAVYQN